MDNKNLGNLIRVRRENLALKQEDLSEMSGVNLRTIYLIENAQGNPSLKTLVKLLEVLGLEIKVQIKEITG